MWSNPRQRLKTLKEKMALFIPQALLVIRVIRHMAECRLLLEELLGEREDTRGQQTLIQEEKFVDCGPTHSTIRAKSILRHGIVLRDYFHLAIY